MSNHNKEVVTLITQLVLSAAIAFVFSFKYKTQLVDKLSSEVYYQVLVISTIISGYVASFIGGVIISIYIKFMCAVSKEFKAGHLQKLLKGISVQEGKTLSPESKKAYDEALQLDYQAEVQIENIQAQISELKGKRNK